jgi:hypothetical protein
MVQQAGAAFKNPNAYGRVNAIPLTSTAACVCQKLDSAILMVKAAKDRS